MNRLRTASCALLLTLTCAPTAVVSGQDSPEQARPDIRPGEIMAAPTNALITRDVPFLESPDWIVDAMLEMAQIREGDIVYDLGSGDGRIVIEAAKRYGVRGVGIEIDDELVAFSRARPSRRVSLSK